MTYRRTTLLLAAIPLALSQMGATDCGQIIKDPGFDLWCGDHLCDWKVDQGDAEQVPTWHAGDDGVSLVGDDVAISQMTPVTSDDGTCIEFSMLTDIADDADVHLQFDVFGDGTVEHDERVPTAHWAPVSFKVQFAAPFNGIRFRLTKTGPGRAVLAEIKAEIAGDCTGAPIPLGPRPDGAWCVTDGDCTSSMCVGIPLPLGPHPVCGECENDASCAAGGDVCGIDDAPPWWLTSSRACVPPGTRQIGESCTHDPECAAGTCEPFGPIGVCSLCGQTLGCPGSESCYPALTQVTLPDGQTGLYLGPRVCDAGLGHGASGEACFRDVDCASARCLGTGEVKTCVTTSGDFEALDGRSCTSDLDCPEGSDLTHLPCVAVGIAGGTCQ